MIPSVYVYALRDPRTKEVRYVGYSKDVDARLRSHLAAAKKPRSHVAYWVASLCRQGVIPEMQAQFVVESAIEAKRIEVALIAHLRWFGARLVNATSGGDGVVDLQHTDEAKRRIGAAWKGRKRAPFSDGHRQRLSLAARNKPSVSIETRRKLSIASTGKRHTPETRATMRRPKTAATREKMRGPKTSEHRLNLRRAWVRRKIAAVARKHPQLVRSMMTLSRSILTAQL